jgi:hypothetical protein
MVSPGKTEMMGKLSSPRASSAADSGGRASVWFVLALVAASSMWFYVDRILVAYQVNDAAAHQRPRGNLSDLYPRWLGARELLLHHRNPYGDDIALEIQKGYYGRALDPGNSNDPKDRQGFAYPVYVVFLLAPLIGFSFHSVQIFFYWLLIALTAVSVWLWLRALRWPVSLPGIAICTALTLGSFPAVQGIKLQQLSLLVAALLAGAMACVASGFLFCGGMLLALSTIKPQLAWPLVAWMLLWSLSEFRVRRRLMIGFVSLLALLLWGAEIILPGWLRMFAGAILHYHQYTQNQSLIDVMLNQIVGGTGGGIVGRFGAQVIAAVMVMVCVPVLLKLRKQPAGSAEFNAATALVLALTVVVVPMYAPYNQLLLLLSILLLVRERSAFIAGSWIRRLGYWFAALLVGWQWFASLCLSLAYLLVSPKWALRAWQWPFFATFALPLWVFAVIFLFAYGECEPSSAQVRNSAGVDAV